jgi:hypothetical protein
MADPRNTVSHDGIGQNFETYTHDATIVYNAAIAGGAAQVGLAVTLIGETGGDVSLVGDGEIVLGRLTLVESDGKCNVQIAGNCQLPGGASASLTHGGKIVGALGASSAEGYIKDAPATTSGALAGRHTIIDPATTTAVWVKLA